MSTQGFDFEGLGIGELLQRYRLKVPPNQRSYAWTEEHVRELLFDVNAAIQNADRDYFLGTLVLIGDRESELEIADGQQRLATTTIILARIRDLLVDLERSDSAQSIENDYLQRIDIETEEKLPRLRLNVDDHQFFVTRILPRSGERTQHESDNLKSSRKRLAEADTIIREFLHDNLITLPPSEHAAWLVRFVKYIEKRVAIAAVIVPDEVGAFRMFETLNDRGLRASQADILKNYLFSRAQHQLAEAQVLWSGMSSIIESIDDDDERLVVYLRHFWITENGHTRERAGGEHQEKDNG